MGRHQAVLEGLGQLQYPHVVKTRADDLQASASDSEVAVKQGGGQRNRAYS